MFLITDMCLFVLFLMLLRDVRIYLWAYGVQKIKIAQTTVKSDKDVQIDMI